MLTVLQLVQVGLFLGLVAAAVGGTQAAIPDGGGHVVPQVGQVKQVGHAFGGRSFAHPRLAVFGTGTGFMHPGHTVQQAVVVGAAWVPGGQLLGKPVMQQSVVVGQGG